MRGGTKGCHVALMLCIMAASVEGDIIHDGDLIGLATVIPGPVIVDRRNHSFDSRAQIGRSSNRFVEINGGAILWHLSADVGGWLSSTSRGTVLVRDPGSAWFVDRTMTVGFSSGPGTLNIMNGGRIATDQMFFASPPAGMSLIEVEGAASALTIRNSLEMWSSSVASEMRVADGGGVYVGDEWFIHDPQPALAQGRIHLDNGHLHVGSFVGPSSALAGFGTIQTQGWIFDDEVILDNYVDTATLWLIPVGDGVDREILVTTKLDSGGVLGAGSEGAGHLVIRDGLPVSSHRGRIGMGLGSSGVVVVEGVETAWNIANDLIVSEHGLAELTIRNGAAGSSLETVIGRYRVESDETDMPAKMTVTGQGSSWSTHGAMVIGREGVGELVIQDGALVHSGFAFLGNGSGRGYLTLRGEGSTWINPGPVILQDAVINVEHGATLNLPATGFNNYKNGPRVEINASSGGSLSIPALVMDQDDRLLVAGGEVFVNTVLDISAGAEVTLIDGLLRADQLILGNGQGLIFTGGRLEVSHLEPGSPVRRDDGDDAPIRIIGDLYNNGGTFAPGVEIGQIKINGSYTQSDLGVLELEILEASRDGNLWDRLVVSGDIFARGTLRLVFHPSYSPQSTRFFRFFIGNHLDIDFHTFDLPALPPGLGWDTSEIGEGVVRIVLASIILGDLNGDGVLDAFDVAPFELALSDRQAFTAAYPDLDADTLGDFDGNGQLDAFDAAGFEAALAGSPVPEPGTTIILGILGALGMIRRTR